MVNAIAVSGVSVVFNMSKMRVNHLKEYIIKMARGELIYEQFNALKNVSFAVEKGDVFGIVGMNGAGKSTLLKVIAGVMSPTKGKVTTMGSLAPLIELGAGFDFELTARENIYLNGSVLGYSRRQINDCFEKIVEFSEINEFLDVPMKNYSTGMVARVGFSIATITNPDILILDEILSVGDFQFQAKCERRITDMIANGATVLVVSHSVEQIKRMCINALWLDKGQIRCIGKAEDVCNLFFRNKERKSENET
jgi:ABC-type polysaccharide/polyol phosphate transport system ATPase subunit